MNEGAGAFSPARKNKMEYSKGWRNTEQSSRLINNINNDTKYITQVSFTKHGNLEEIMR